MGVDGVIHWRSLVGGVCHHGVCDWALAMCTAKHPYSKDKNRTSVNCLGHVLTHI